MTDASSVGARRYGGRRKHGLAWLPWLALLLLALIGLGIWALVHHLDSGDAGASSVTSPGAAAVVGIGTGGMVGGSTVAAAPADATTGAAADPNLAGTILFAENSAAVDNAGSTVISNAARLLQQEHAARAVVTGYTDVVGNQPVNGSLSQQRADAVASVLRQKMGGSITITTTAEGEQGPVAANSNSDGSDNPQGRQMNRRAVIAQQ